jgi:hypothetical protein
MVTVPLPTLAPRSLRQYGENPWGEPLWRCVYAPSVKKIVGGRFADGFTGYRARPAYRHIGNFWVLEKWISAFDLTHKTEAQYNAREFDESTKTFPTGPYPHRGIYHYCETLSCTPDDANFDKLIAWIAKGQFNRPQDNMRALMDTMEKKEKAEQDERFDRMKELLPAFGIRAANIGGRVKATKSAPMTRTANELGLPFQGPRVQRVNHAV